MAPDVIYPVEELRKTLESLNGVRSLCRTEPEPKAVHRLRTLTRRIGAQMFLLDAMPGIPKHKKDAKRLRKELKELRQGAGDVRDLDVQRKRIADLPMAESEIAPGRFGGTPVATEELQQGINLLDAHLQGRRHKAAEALQAHIERHEARFLGAAQALLGHLDEAHRLPLSPEELLVCAESLVSAHALMKKNLRRTLTEKELHSVRKAAKAARYLAEMMPRHDGTGEAAVRFEALQDAGGAWHDDLQLARTSKVVLGRKHPLTVRITSERKRKLRLFREALRAEARRVEARRVEARRVEPPAADETSTAAA